MIGVKPEALGNFPRQPATELLWTAGAREDGDAGRPSDRAEEA